MYYWQRQRPFSYFLGSTDLGYLAWGKFLPFPGSVNWEYWPRGALSISPLCEGSGTSLKPHSAAPDSKIQERDMVGSEVQREGFGELHHSGMPGPRFILFNKYLGSTNTVAHCSKGSASCLSLGPGCSPVTKTPSWYPLYRQES